MEDFREAIALDNKHVGYVYLVDENVKIRWAGCADATPEEREALLKCTDVLLKRFDATNKPKAKPPQHSKSQ
jgi:ATPase complex subunit ATP10